MIMSEIEYGYHTRMRHHFNFNDIENMNITSALMSMQKDISVLCAIAQRYCLSDETQSIENIQDEFRNLSAFFEVFYTSIDTQMIRLCQIAEALETASHFITPKNIRKWAANDLHKIEFACAPAKAAGETR